MRLMLGRMSPVLLVCAASFAQQAAPPKPAEGDAQHKINVLVNEVIVPVTVTDDKNRFVSNLEQGDFRIYEDGREQKIVYFNRERNQPVVIGFLLDLSNRNRLHWKSFQETAMELVWALMPDEERSKRKFTGFLVTYANDAELAVNTTEDPAPIADKIRKLKPGGGSALFDAIYLGITKHNLVKGEPIEPRRVLIIVGDGNDSASKHTLDQVIEIAQRNLVTVYGISTVAFGFTSEGDANLRRLCEETGGRVEYPLQDVYKDVSGYLSQPSDEGNYAIKVGTGGYASALAKNMFNAIVAVAGDVTTQYILRYIPDNTDIGKQFRNLKVEVRLPDVKVRVRKGYYPYAP